VPIDADILPLRQMRTVEDIGIVGNEDDIVVAVVAVATRRSVSESPSMTCTILPFA
jgi:hypothetical protein